MTLHEKALSLPCPYCEAKARRGCTHMRVAGGHGRPVRRRILTAGVRTRRRVHVARYISARAHMALEAS